MSADARHPSTPSWTDLIEDSAFLAMLFSGATIAVVIALMLIVF